MERQFNTVPMGKLVLKLGIPALSAQFFNILYSIVDRIFVGNIAGQGSLALASVGICAPAVTCISAFAFMIGIGGSAIMSMSIGRGDREKAQHTINNALVMLIGIAIIVTVAILTVKKPILYMLGCSDRMYPLANTYFTIYVLGTIFSLIGVGMNQFILAQGYARQGMISVVIGAIVNVILDPILIFGLDMGIAGAALATVIAQICTMIYVLRFLCRNDIPVKIGFGGYSASLMKNISTIGIMSFLITLLDNAILIILNMQLRKYGGDALGDTYIACAAIVQSFMVLINSPGQGIASGCGTLFSYHYGAGNYKKVMEAFKGVLILCASFIAVLWVVAQFTPEPFVRLFSSDGSNVEMTVRFLSMYTIGIMGIAIQLAFVDGLTAMGKIRYAMPLSLFRKFVYLASVFILPAALNAEAIFYTATVADIVGSCFTLIAFLTFVRPRLKKEMNA
ncbi:MAG: MATE family efflux transporter [Firmicutes bacterium]|nr:MATE family efflux transporter [Bacillota bacterium]